MLPSGATAVLRRRLSLVLALLLAAGSAVAQPSTQTSAQTSTQTKPADLTPADTMTLHVVVRELQVAALVLDSHRRPVARVDPASFRLQIEHRPRFQPMRVHREGDDPITLAVLLDASREQKYLDQLPDALATLREKALLPHDRLLISAVDCKGLIYKGDTSTPESVRTGVQQLLASGMLHDGMHKGRPRLCTDRAHVWDEVAYALHRVASEPGRHAVLVVSEGYDYGSLNTLAKLEEFTTAVAGTVFVLPSLDMSGPNVRRSPLDQLVMMSGGAVLEAPGKEGIAPSLLECVEMLRDRYILGFNQPSHLKNGHNDLHVTIQHASYDIRASGVSTPGEVPVSDPARSAANPSQANATEAQPAAGTAPPKP